jgi:hypothetical protein
MKAQGVDRVGSKGAAQLIKWTSRALYETKMQWHLKHTASSMVAGSGISGGKAVV